MAEHTFTDNGEWVIPYAAQEGASYRTLAYQGDLGGGTLSVETTIDTVTAPVPDGKLTAATLDANGDVVKSFPFRCSGRVTVKLSGATAPNVKVAAL